MAYNIGKVVQVIGPVIDVEFEPEQLPEIYTAVRIKSDERHSVPVDVVCEVQQHIGRNQVRTVAMDTSDGIVRGMSAVDTGGPGNAWTNHQRAR